MGKVPPSNIHLKLQQLWSSCSLKNTRAVINALTEKTRMVQEWITIHSTAVFSAILGSAKRLNLIQSNEALQSSASIWSVMFREQNVTAAKKCYKTMKFNILRVPKIGVKCCSNSQARRYETFGRKIKSYCLVSWKLFITEKIIYTNVHWSDDNIVLRLCK